LLKNKLVNKVKMFLYAVLAGIRINVIGQLGGNEILAVVDSLSIPQWKKLYRDVPDIKKVNIAYVFMFIFQVISDFINHSDSHDYIRGWAAIIMAIITLNFLAKILLKTFDSIIFFFIGTALYFIFFKPQDDYTFGDFGENMGSFKFYVIPIVNNLVFVASLIIMGKSKKPNNPIVALFLFYGLVCITFDARSNGAFFIITSLFFLFKEQFISYSRTKALALLMIFLILFQGLYIVYVKEVQSGKIGGEHTEVQMKRVNYSYNPLYLLFIGRTEFFVAIKAIQDEPVFGHGSWAPDPTGEYTLMILAMQDEDQNVAALFKSDERHLIIPAHSVLIGAWLDGGVGAFIAIMFIFILYLRRCFYLLANKSFIYSRYFPILVYFMLNGFWIFLFSPLPHIKDSLPLMIAFVTVMYQKLQNQELIQ